VVKVVKKLEVCVTLLCLDPRRLQKAVGMRFALAALLTGLVSACGEPDAADNAAMDSDVQALTSLTIGESAILTDDESYDANTLIAQAASLGQAATIQSLSCYVTTTAGKLRMGVYDATGPGGGPGAKRAETGEVTPVIGWNTTNVVTPVALSAGTYWLAFVPSSNNLHTRVGSTGTARYYTHTYGALPATFSTSPDKFDGHFSLYATLTADGGNPPPTVASPAVASPSPVAANTSGLSVLGASASGEASLAYTWATTGTPPAAVSFSINGTNAAKNTVVTFVKAGSYVLQATIKDAANQTVTSGVTVLVSQTLTSVAVTPASASVSVNGTQQFTANGTDQFGQILSPAPTLTWAVTGGGTMNASAGLFTAGATTGGPFTVTATSGAFGGTAAVTVTAASTSVTLGEAGILTTDDTRNANHILAQVASLGQTATIQSVSCYIATVAGKLRMGVYDATGPGGGPGAKRAETGEITPVSGWNTANVLTPVTLPAGSYWLAFLPNSNSLHTRVTHSGSERYYTFTYGTLPAVFSTSPSSLTEHTSLYATLTPTTYVPTLTSIVVAPASVRVMVGGTQQFSAVGYDQLGAPLAPQPVFAWTVSGGGAVDAASGHFTAGAAAGGPFTVTAASGGYTGTATLNIDPAGDGSNPTVGGHGFSHHTLRSSSGGPVTTPAMTTQSGSTMLVFVGRESIYNLTLPYDNMGNAPYVQMGPSHIYAEWDPEGTAMYAFPSITGGANHVVSVNDPAGQFTEVSFEAVEVRNGGVVQDYKWNEVLNATIQTSASVTTTGPATLVAVWFGEDASSTPSVAIPNAGFTIIDGTGNSVDTVQIFIATKDVAAAGTYSMTWTTTPLQSAELYLVAVQKP